MKLKLIEDIAPYNPDGEFPTNLLLYNYLYELALVGDEESINETLNCFDIDNDV